MRKRRTHSCNSQDSGLAHVLRLFSAFEVAEPEVSEADLAGETDLSLSTIRRYIAWLRQRGHAQVGAPTRTYRIGPRVLALARHYQTSDNVGDVAKPPRASLRDESDATAPRFASERTTAVCVEQVASSFHPVKLIIERGRVMPLHGRAMLGLSGHSCQRS